MFLWAELYSYRGCPREEFHQANVECTHHMPQAPPRGRTPDNLHPPPIAPSWAVPTEGTPATEDTPSSLMNRINPCQRSEFLAEKATRDFAGKGLPVVIVSSSTPVDVGDHLATPSGQIMVHFLNGRVRGYGNAGLNIVNVGDGGAGHPLAAHAPPPRTRYVSPVERALSHGSEVRELGLPQTLPHEALRKEVESHRAHRHTPRQ